MEAIVVMAASSFEARGQAAGNISREMMDGPSEACTRLTMAAQLTLRLLEAFNETGIRPPPTLAFLEDRAQAQVLQTQLEEAGHGIAADLAAWS